MPVTPTYPGVYVEEVPSGVRTIVGVATSITAFVGRTRWGETNKPVICNSFGDFERFFGGLHENYPLSYSVRDFFINGGSQAMIVRLVGPNFVNDTARDAAVAVRANERGAAEHVSAGVQSAADIAAAKNAATTRNDEIQNANPAKSNAEKAAAQAVSDAVNAATTLEEAKAAATAAIPPEFKVPGKSSLKLPVSNTENLELEAANPGAWSSDLRARVDYEGTAQAAERYKPLKADKLFNLTIVNMRTGAAERFLAVTAEDHLRNIRSVLKNESTMLRVKGTPPSVRPKESDDGLSSDDLKVPAFSPEDTKRSVGVAEGDTGSEGEGLTQNDYTSGEGLENNKMGLYALSQADLFNLLVIPPDTRGGDLPPGLISDAVKYCADHRAMLIVDAPTAWRDVYTVTTSSVSDLGLAGNGARNAAIYFPRVVQADTRREGQPDTFPPGGIVAGVMARTDVTRGVWKAPAGTEAGVLGITRLATTLSDAENGMLNPLGINCLRTFPAAGTVVWGARTARGADQLADEYKYVPVRRLALFLEESLYRGLQWVVFEPNDEPLWAQIRLNVGSFMHDLFRRGAFQGRTPREAYFVKCDKETTTQNDINLGIVNVLVGFAPLKPAEFVILKLQQMAGQIQV